MAEYREAILVACPECAARRYNPCINANGSRMRWFLHPARWRVAAGMKP
jgi:hypothetical protein